MDRIRYPRQPEWWYKKQWVWKHNQIYGSICRAWRLVNLLADEKSLTEDAKHHLNRAWEHLRLAREEVFLRRVEEDGTITKIERKTPENLLGWDK